VTRDILVSYDVSTESEGGPRRLRRVAKACKDYGQRVQYSVFECTVDSIQMEKLRQRLVKIIDPELDSLRIYTLQGGREQCVKSYGIDKYVDFEEPLIV
jgi:CRISPR-associated protein Cas2